MIDWCDPACQITEHFSVKDAIFLHGWGRLANSADGLDDKGKAQLLLTFQMLEKVRAVLNCPLNVHCGYRSRLYNVSNKIMLPTGLDVHAMFEAVDFDANPHLTIQQIKDILVPQLSALNIRLERGTTTWIHCDLHPVGPSGRFFAP